MPESKDALIIGIDGGQTSTKSVLATTRGQVLGYGRGGPLIHLAADGSRERFILSVGTAIRAAWDAAGLAPRPVQAIGLGLTGVEADTPEAATVLALLPSCVDAQAAEVQNDGIAALAGAHLGQPGVIVISGTGTISLGIDPQGRLGRAGGWGWLIGDEGSAVDIGRRGLMAALYAFDGIGAATLLEPGFRQYFGIASLLDAKRRVYASDFGARGFAALAQVVSTAAAEGDPIARGIVTFGGQALAREVAAVIRRLDFAGQAVPVAPVGGAFEHITGLRQAFSDALAAQPVAAIVISAHLPPILGAAILALRLCAATPGFDLAAAISRLQATTPPLPGG
ncbi:MAG: N-acetylglucosamine kinase [Chloroflexi bacterium]|nr:N-acetylglucosamine kinase [Chloroflexota bacterium]